MKNILTNIEWYSSTNYNFSENTLGIAILSNNIIRTGANFSVGVNNSNHEEQGGLFASPDGYGTSYYFRGTHDLNNNVIFAGYQWKIIRIQGDGHIKLLYNGPCPESNCQINAATGSTTTRIANIYYNSPDQDNRGVRFMFGDSCTTLSECHANEIDSNAKITLDNWINNESNFSIQAMNQIELTTFCADASFADNNVQNASVIQNGTLGIAQAATYYSGMQRFDSPIPRLICPDTNNSKINTIIGLITVDELKMAGVRGSTGEWTDTFVWSGIRFATMTPYRYSGSHSRVFVMNSSGNISWTGVTSGGVGEVSLAIRPVIALNRTVIITSGDGNIETPYMIQL